MYHIQHILGPDIGSIVISTYTHAITSDIHAIIRRSTVSNDRFVEVQLMIDELARMRMHNTNILFACMQLTVNDRSFKDGYSIVKFLISMSGNDIDMRTHTSSISGHISGEFTIRLRITSANIRADIIYDGGIPDFESYTSR